MKKIFIIILSCIFALNYSKSQTIDSVVYQVNTIGEMSASGELQFWIYPKLNKNEELGIGTDETETEIRNKEDDKSIGIGKLGEKIGKRYIVGNFNLSKSLIKYLIDDNSNYYLYIKNTIRLFINNTIDTEKNRIIDLTPSELKAATLEKLKFNKDYFDVLLNKYGDASFMYGNFLDAGSEVDTDDSSKSNYIFQFNYTTTLFGDKNLNLAASGRFSTKSNDPLSRFSFFPVYYNKLFLNTFIPFQFTFLPGIEGNQNFTIQKVSTAAELQSIVPNFINFTGGADRIRLKPIFKTGIKWLKEYKTDNKNDQLDNDGQIYLELYYYIPVYKSYSILLTGNAFNNFTGNTSGNGWLYQYNLTLGVELPVNGFKVIAKYTQGTNDIAYEYDSQLILGLLMDISNK